MRGSCHLDGPSNVEIGVEYQIFNVVVKCILGYLQDLEKVPFTKIAEQFVLLFIPAKHKKVNKHFQIDTNSNIRHDPLISNVKTKMIFSKKFALLRKPKLYQITAGISQPNSVLYNNFAW